MSIGSQIGRQTLQVGVNAVGLTMPPSIKPDHMRATVENGAVRWECGPNVTPTSSEGQLAPVGSAIEFMDPMVSAQTWIVNFKVIAVGGPATLQVQYFD